MEERNLVKVVIPIYKTDLNEYEKIALSQCFSVLKNYSIVFVKPESLDIRILEKEYGNRFCIENFPDEYFADIKAYNRLMLSSDFYKRFLDVKYILIYQTDAYVFSDSLKEWCEKGYDYIGAPWIPKFKYLRWHYHFFLGARILFSRYLRPFNHHLRLLYAVGNGGFSLRNTEKFYNIAIELSDRAAYYIAHCDQPIYNEDVFWSLETNRKCPKLNIPSYNEAIGFSFEENPDVSLLLNKGKLPFGTHAWYKPKQINFWRQFIAMNCNGSQ